MAVSVDYDTGWNEGLNCSGKGGWSTEIKLVNGMATFKMSNAGEQITVYGFFEDNKWRFDYNGTVDGDSWTAAHDTDSFVIETKKSVSIFFDTARPVPRSFEEMEKQRES